MANWIAGVIRKMQQDIIRLYQGINTFIVFLLWRITFLVNLGLHAK